VEMHTSGEPTRIVYSGLPDFPSEVVTLHEKRQYMRSHHDSIRRCLMLEPRGHAGMYGAVILPSTSNEKANTAQVAFICASEPGYTPMCGHATMALARFLVDYPSLINESLLSEQERLALPSPDSYPYNADTQSKQIHIEVPCGILDVTVPVLSQDGRSDPNRPASFISVPSWAQLDVSVPVLKAKSSAADDPWVQLQKVAVKGHLTGDLGYGGGWYFVIPAAALGIENIADTTNLAKLQELAAALLRTVRVDKRVAEITGKNEDNRADIYGVVLSAPFVSGRFKAFPGQSPTPSELGLCVYSAGQLDRSPTGGAVAARQAIAHAKGTLTQGVQHAYYSPTSIALGRQGAFMGSVEAQCARSGGEGTDAVQVRVEGTGFYTGLSEVLVEAGDPLCIDGFV
ncbi:Diaminopimelate epimerase-like protein, partial [Myriangium duriaei CBS 260.36]